MRFPLSAKRALRPAWLVVGPDDRRRTAPGSFYQLTAKLGVEIVKFATRGAEKFVGVGARALVSQCHHAFEHGNHFRSEARG